MSKADLKILACMCLWDCWCIIPLPSSPNIVSSLLTNTSVQQPDLCGHKFHVTGIWERPPVKFVVCLRIETVPKWVKLNHPIHLLQQPAGDRHSTCPRYLKSTSTVKEVKAQNHYMKSTKIKGYMQKNPKCFVSSFISFTLFGFVFVFPQRSQRPRWQDTWWSVYWGCTLKMSLWCTFEWSSCLSRSGAGPQVLGEAASPPFCAGGSNVPGSPFFLFCNVLVGTATSCTAAAWFKVLR